MSYLNNTRTAKAVMLPSNKESPIFLGNNKYLFSKLEQNNYQLEQNNCQYQNIYVIDEITPEENDWILLNNKIFFVTLAEGSQKTLVFKTDNAILYLDNYKSAKRVVATTDKLLEEISCPDKIEGCEVYHIKSAPLIDNAFLNDYVGAFNDDDKIVDVIVNVSDKGEVKIIPMDKKYLTLKETEILCREAFKLYKGDNTGYPGLIRSQKEAENDWIEKNIYGKI